MRIRSIFLFLLGDRESILELAHSRWTLVVGALLVLSAGLARNYDGEDLAREPWYLLGPFAASILTSAGLFALLLFVARVRGGRRAKVWASWRLYPRFLAIYWMTAPLAWLYAVPYERFTTPVRAVEANLWTLAIVATWRVALMARVVGVLTRATLFPVLIWTMFYGAVVMFMAVVFMPKPSIIDAMGGLHVLAEDRLLIAVTFKLGCSMLVAAPVLFILGCIFNRQLEPQWPPDRPSATVVSPRRAIVIAVAGGIAWLPALLLCQPEQRLRRDVETAMTSGRLREGVTIMAAHSRSDFPPHWRPPHDRTWGYPPNVIKPAGAIRAIIDETGAPQWVVELYPVLPTAERE